MSATTKVYNEFIQNFQRNSDYTIQFFSNNLLFLSNLRSFDGEEEFRKFMEMYHEYMHALVEKGRYNDAIDTAAVILLLIEPSMDKFQIDRSTFDYYKWTLYKKAQASYNLRDYKSAYPEFKQLYEYEPGNDALKKWVDYSKYGKRLWIQNMLYVIGFAGFLIDLAGKSYLSPKLRLVPMILATMAMIAALTMQLFVTRNKRNANKMAGSARWFRFFKSKK
jgi:tetratricopeptide (TPR) repeat protein